MKKLYFILFSLFSSTSQAFEVCKPPSCDSLRVFGSSPDLLFDHSILFGFTFVAALMVVWGITFTFGICRTKPDLTFVPIERRKDPVFQELMDSYRQNAISWRNDPNIRLWRKRVGPKMFFIGLALMSILIYFDRPSHSPVSGSSFNMVSYSYDGDKRDSARVLFEPNGQITSIKGSTMISYGRYSVIPGGIRIFPKDGGKPTSWFFDDAMTSLWKVDGRLPDLYEPAALIPEAAEI